MKKLNLGCGLDYKKGYINVDIRNDVGADLVHDVTKPFPFPSASISKIIAQDIFEHLTIEQQSLLFSEIFRLLIDGGELDVRIPNNEEIWKRFSKDVATRDLFLFGDTSESGVWGSHKSGHSLNSFMELATISGFVTLKHSSVDTNYVFKFIKDTLPKLKGVVFINQTLGMGGAENFNTQLLVWFQKHKTPVKALTTFSPFNKSFKNFGIKSVKIPIVVDVIGNWKGLVKGLVLFPFAALYYAYITYKNRDSGTILLTGFIEKILVTPWAKFFNIPIVWVEFGPLQEIFSKFFGFPKFLYRLVSKLPDFVIEPSQNTRINNLNVSGLSTAKTKFIPCGINPLKPSLSTPRNLTAYCVSRMEQGKGQDLLIMAWPKVLRKFPKAKLYFIGDGNFQYQLQKLVNKLKLSNSVTFLGVVENLEKEVSNFSLGVFPSVWPLEGFGLVLLEAMSLGKPIVCFNFGPYPEIVNSDCSIMVEKGNINDLSEAIIRIFSNPSLAKKLGENGKKRFSQHFTMAKIAPLYYKVLLKAQIAGHVKNLLHRNQAER